MNSLSHDASMAFIGHVRVSDYPSSIHYLSILPLKSSIKIKYQKKTSEKVLLIKVTICELPKREHNDIFRVSKNVSKKFWDIWWGSTFDSIFQDPCYMYKCSRRCECVGRCLHVFSLSRDVSSSSARAASWLSVTRPPKRPLTRSPLPRTAAHL